MFGSDAVCEYVYICGGTCLFDDVYLFFSRSNGARCVISHLDKSLLVGSLHICEVYMHAWLYGFTAHAQLFAMFKKCGLPTNPLHASVPAFSYQIKRYIFSFLIIISKELRGEWEPGMGLKIFFLFL